jgi:hypothetical protein
MKDYQAIEKLRREADDFAVMRDRTSGQGEK